MTSFVDDYVRQVEAACADLPDDLRRRLITDLSAHLHEIDTATGNVYAELGPPEEYARELREALELPPQRRVESTAFGPPRLIAAATPPARNGLPAQAILGIVALVVLFALVVTWVLPA